MKFLRQDRATIFTYNNNHVYLPISDFYPPTPPDGRMGFLTPQKRNPHILSLGANRHIAPSPPKRGRET